MEYWEWQGLDTTTVWWLLGFGLIIILVFLIFFFRRRSKSKADPTALQVLQQQFAQGEISKEEYLEAKRKLQEE